MLSSVLVWLSVGLIAGALGRLAYPGPLSIGPVMVTLFGIVGSLLGGLAAWIVAGAPQGDFRGSGWILSFAGALLVVWAAERMNESSVESM